jgi:hypothetical protein
MVRNGGLPQGFNNPQAHHDLPWVLRDWFAGAGRGMNVNDPAYGRWVEGGSVHQGWSRRYNEAWRDFIRKNPNATRQQVLDYLQQLLNSGQFPSQ